MAAIIAARRAASLRRKPPTDENDVVDEVDLSLKPLPPPEERLLSAIVDKRVQTNDGHLWQNKFVVLTAQALHFARTEEENNVIDMIPLADIEKIDAVDTQNGTKRRMSLSSILPEDEEATFNIMTSENGHNSGRTYTIKMRIFEVNPRDSVKQLEAARKECNAWVDAIRSGVTAEKARLKRLAQGTDFDRVRYKVKHVYESNIIQGVIAAVILASFFLNLVNAELLPQDDATIRTFDRLDLAFTIIFTVELAANFFANYWYPFWRESWNLFDTFVVAISLLSLAMEELPAVNMLRLIRIFRVIRLFRALRSLRQILNALIASIFPVISSFLVLLLGLILTCIYAVLGTMFFHERDEEHFSKFSQSLFTMFQVCTGDSWASVVARGNFREAGNGWDHAVKFFFLSYILIANMVLVNIVVAVLLDNFITSVSNEKAEEKKRLRDIELKKRPKVTGVLDPVLQGLSQFSGPLDLTKRVESLYKFLDIDDNGGLSFGELREGLRKFPATPHIKLTEEDFDAITEDRTLCNTDGEMDPHTFEVMMLRQLQSFALRQLANTMLEVSGDKLAHESLLSFKMLSLSVEGFFQQRLGQYANFAAPTSPLPYRAHLSPLPGPGPTLYTPAGSFKLSMALPTAGPGRPGAAAGGGRGGRDGNSSDSGSRGRRGFESASSTRNLKLSGQSDDSELGALNLNLNALSASGATRAGAAAGAAWQRLAMGKLEGEGEGFLKGEEEGNGHHPDHANTPSQGVTLGGGPDSDAWGRHREHHDHDHRDRDGMVDGAANVRFQQIEDRLLRLDSKVDRILDLLIEARASPRASESHAESEQQQPEEQQPKAPRSSWTQGNGIGLVPADVHRPRDMPRGGDMDRMVLVHPASARETLRERQSNHDHTTGSSAYRIAGAADRGNGVVMDHVRVERDAGEGTHDQQPSVPHPRALHGRNQTGGTLPDSETWKLDRDPLPSLWANGMAQRPQSGLPPERSERDQGQHAEECDMGLGNSEDRARAAESEQSNVGDASYTAAAGRDRDATVSDRAIQVIASGGQPSESLARSAAKGRRRLVANTAVRRSSSASTSRSPDRALATPKSTRSKYLRTNVNRPSTERSSSS